MSKEFSFLVDKVTQHSALNGDVEGGTVRNTKNRLTESEVETLHLLSFGYTVTQVSRILDKSVKTVSAEMQCITQNGIEKSSAQLIGDFIRFLGGYLEVVMFTAFITG